MAMSERKTRAQLIKYHASQNKLRNSASIDAEDAPRGAAATGDSFHDRLSSSQSSGEENKTPSAANAKGARLTAGGKKKFVAFETALGELRTSSIRSSASADRLRNLATAVTADLRNGGDGSGGGGSEASFNDEFADVGAASPGATAAAAGKGPLLRAASGSDFGFKKSSGGGGLVGRSPIGKAASLYDPHADETSSVASTTPSTISFNKFSPSSDAQLRTAAFRKSASFRAGLKPMAQVLAEVEEAMGRTTGTGSFPDRVAKLEKALGLEAQGKRLTAGLVDRVRAIAYEVCVPVEDEGDTPTRL